MKKTICLDFDGVIHSYKSGWEGIETCEDEPVEGTCKAIAKLREKFVVKVFPSRCKLPLGLFAVKNYLRKHKIVVDEVCDFKPIAAIYLDDRGIQFNGDWDEALTAIDNFKHWIKKES